MQTGLVYVFVMFIFISIYTWGTSSKHKPNLSHLYSYVRITNKPMRFYRFTHFSPLLKRKKLYDINSIRVNKYLI